MRKKSSTPVFQPKTHWSLFGCFAFTNGLLVFSPLSLAWKAAFGILGLALPMAIILMRDRGPTRSSKPLWSDETLLPTPGWIWPLLILAAAFFRFIHLTTLSQWPLTDEAKSGYFAMQLAAQGPGSAKLLYDFSQLPPLYIWMEGLFFKAFGVSLFSLWCFPAILSLLTVLAFYQGARVHFSKSFALLLGALMALSFWPLYTGRFSHQGSLLLLWECLAFWLAGKLGKTVRGSRSAAGGKGLKPPGRPAPTVHLERSKQGFYLGLLVGAGFYTFTSWPGVALVAALWIFYFHRRILGPFLGGAILVYLPLGIAWLMAGYGGYIQHVWALNPGEAWGPQLLRGFWDFCALFWKSAVPPNLFAYKPFWGGYLNPLLGACFFLGTVVLVKQVSTAWVRFWALAFLVFYLPGFLTGGVEMFRILPLLPLLLGGAALGFAGLLGSLKASWRWPVLGLLLLFSLSLDSHHLFRVYRDVWTHPDGWFASKSVDRLRAYSLLEEIQNQSGPGIILFSLVPDLYDQSLSIATHEFNVAQNPGISQVQPHWTAVLANVHFQPCLASDFPEGKWVRLAGDMGWPDGGLALDIIPLPCSHPEKLSRLIRADQAMNGLVPMVFDDRDYRSRQPVMERLAALHPLFVGDSFLEACFWEKMSDNAYGDRNYEAQVGALRQAIERGTPAAHLYNDLGTLYLRRSRFKEARSAFEKALHCEPNYTSAAEGLRMLDQAEKTGRLPKD